MKHKNMNIIHLSPYFLPEYSGTSIRLYNLISRLPSQNIVITSNETMQGEIISPNRERIGNIEIIRVALKSDKKIFNRVPFNYIYMIAKQPQLLSNMALGIDNIDIIHTHSNILFDEAGKILKAKTQKPLIYEVHVIENDYSNGIIKNYYVNRYMTYMVHHSDHIVSLSNAFKNWLIDMYKLPEDKITVIPNGVDTKIFNSTIEISKQANELKDRLGISNKVIMYAGYMDNINGFDSIIALLPGLIKEKSKLTFLFIGHGPFVPLIKSLANSFPNNIKYFSMIPYSLMPLYYQLSDVFIIPRPSTISTENITPLKLLEVMSMNKVVLGSDVGGISEVILHGQNGYLFNKGDINSFKNILLDIIDSECQKVRISARQTVIDKYNWDNSANILQKVYENI